MEVDGGDEASVFGRKGQQQQRRGVVPASKCFELVVDDEFERWRVE